MTEQLSLFPEGQTQDTEFELVKENRIEQAEWCFQFFDNEPVVFAFTKSDEESSNLVIELRPTTDDTLTFTQKGMSFKIFPREMSEETKKAREEQNASENQEAAQ
jgi:hypothetical protein